MLHFTKQTTRRVLLSAALLMLTSWAVSVHAQTLPTKRWSTSYPTTGAVVIPLGENVLLDVNLNVTTLSILGRVVCDNKHISVTARWIMVHGELQCGTATTPFLHRLVLTLVGTNAAEDVMGMGTKFLGAMSGGIIQLHGATRVNWTRLATTALKGSAQITLQIAPSWRVGERIVIASSDYRPEHAEEVAITAIAGNVVSLSRPLTYTHWCQNSTFGTATLQECAEVGLLSRNIVIRGDAASVAGGFGGHAMVMSGSVAKISGVEFFQMGQRGRIARYPFHWHMVGNAVGQYLKNSSIHHVYNRFVSVHGTHSTLLSNNVGYDTVGHGFYLEDGIETKNVFSANLGLRVRNATDGKPTPSDRQASVFWISNPDNTVRDNVAAGADDTGFWLGFPEHPIGLSATTAVWPRRTALRDFTGNISHSNGNRGLYVDGAERPDRTTTTTWYEPRQTPTDGNSPIVTPVFRAFTAYKNRGEGVWIRSFAGPVLSGAKLADNWMGVYWANLVSRPAYTNVGVVDLSLVVGETGNKGNPETWETKGLDGRELPHFWSPQDSIRGVQFYDGPMAVSRTIFANFQSNTQRKAGGLTSLAPNSFNVSSLNFSQAVSFVNANRVYLHDLTPNNSGDAFSTFLDKDGTVSGTAGKRIVPKNPVLVTPQCTLNALWNAYVCPHDYMNLQVHVSSGESLVGTILRRDDGASVPLASAQGYPSGVNVNVITERPYVVQFPTVTPKIIDFVVPEKPGKAVRVSMAYPPSAFTVTRWGSPVYRANSLAELTTGGHKYFYDGTRLHLRVVNPSGTWEEVRVRRP